MPKPTKVLFVCMGNCVRSQIAEAIARHSASDVISAESAGVHPLGFIDEIAQKALAERDISVDGQFSKGLHHHTLSTPDLIINMSGLPGATLFQGRLYENWRVRDPFGENLETHRRICDDIEARIKELAARLRTSNS